MTRHNCPGFNECSYCDHLAVRQEMGLDRHEGGTDWQRGQDRYERQADERGTTQPLWLVVGATGIALCFLAIVEPRLLAALFVYVAVALVLGVVLGRGIAKRGAR